jgi:serine/threonine-protein kinase ATR
VRLLNELGGAIAAGHQQGAGRGRQAGAAPEQLQALRALALLTRALGASIANHTPQIMAVLSDALLHLQQPALQLQALAGWHVFVRQLAGQGAGTLARVAAQAAVVLLPLLERPGEAMAAAVRILEELLITNAAHVGDAFARMPPLPSVPALAGVNAALAAQQRLDGPAERLALLVRATRHESLNVRHAALGELRAFMTSGSGQGHVAALVSEAVSQEAGGGGAGGAAAGAAGSARAAASELVSALLGSCDNAARTRLALSLKQLAAQCLGLLGAVDPARLAVAAVKAEALETGEGREAGLLMKLMTQHLVRVPAGGR